MNASEPTLRFVVMETVYLKPPVDRLVVTGMVKRGHLRVGDRLLARCAGGNREVTVEAIEIPEGRTEVHRDEHPSLRLAGAPEGSIKRGDKLLGLRATARARELGPRRQVASQPQTARTQLQGESELFGPRRTCPVCGQPMLKQRMVGGVIIDACKQHGLWLDKGELAAIVCRARGFNQFEFRNRIRRAKFAGRADGLLFGWFSFLFDY